MDMDIGTDRLTFINRGDPEGDPEGDTEGEPLGDLERGNEIGTESDIGAEIGPRTGAGTGAEIALGKVIVIGAVIEIVVDGNVVGFCADGICCKMSRRD